MPSRSDANVGDRSACEFGETIEVAACILRKLVPGFALGGVASPTGKSFVDGDDAVPSVAIGGREFVLLAVDLIMSANLNRLALVEAVEIGNGEAGDSIDHAGIAEENHIEPTA